MMPELKQRLLDNPNLEIVILQGVQNREDILYDEAFCQFASTHPRATFWTHLSRETQPLRAHEKPGYVQSSFDSLKLDPKEDMVYLCGNPAMIDESFAYLKEKGFEMQSIVREKYISAK